LCRAAIAGFSAILIKAAKKEGEQTTRWDLQGLPTGDESFGLEMVMRDKTRHTWIRPHLHLQQTTLDLCGFSSGSGNRSKFKPRIGANANTAFLPRAVPQTPKYGGEHEAMAIGSRSLFPKQYTLCQ
jgi:hypothetical protein